MPPIPRLRDYAGPSVLSYGFRLFYLIGALFSGLSVLVWLAMLGGDPPRIGAFEARDWHIHELLFGFLPAIIGGYVLTAVPNWTGRFPVQGAPVVVLALAWAAGRIAVLLSGALGAAATMVLDCVFLALLIAAVLREIVASGSPRNGGIAAVLTLLLAGNAIFHIEVWTAGTSDLAWRIGVATVIGLITMIAGRIVPSFTRNWLARRKHGPLPRPVGWFDTVCVAVAFGSLLLWSFAPYGAVVCAVLIGAGGLHAVRLVRWAGYRTLRNPLVFIMHVAYGFIPAGFVLTAFSALGAVAPSAGVHAFMAGAAGTMVLAVMTRTSLGLTGRARKAGPGTQIVYVLVVTGAVLRILAALWPESPALLHAGGAAWAAAYIGFVAVYWRALTGPRAAP